MNAPISQEDLSYTPAKQLQALVVDDDPMVATIASRMLEFLGFRTHVADGSTSALPMLKKNCYDLVITDLMMPHMNGFDLAKHVRSYSKEFKIVIMTGRHPSDIQTEMASATVDRWLFKPFHLDKLKQIIGELFPCSFNSDNASA